MMRLSAAVDFFLSAWPAESPSPDTVRSYTQSLRGLVAFAQQRSIDELVGLTPTVVRAAMLEKMSETTSHASTWKGGEVSAANLLFALRFMLRWLARQGLPVPDLSGVRAPRVPERIQPRVTWEEFDRMERAVLQRLIAGGAGKTRRTPRVAVTRDLVLLNFLAETGLRAQELAHLAVQDIDFERGLVTVRRGKGKKERVLCILGAAEDPDPRRVLRLLEDWVDARASLRGAKDHSLLWTSSRGHALASDEIRRVLGRICLEAGLQSARPPHAFRRFQFTERYRERPGAIKQLAARMGWSEKSQNMINVYTRGVEMEFARDRIPLMASRSRPALQARQVPSGDLAGELTAAVRNNPELARVLLQALKGAA